MIGLGHGAEAEKEKEEEEKEEYGPELRRLAAPPAHSTDRFYSVRTADRNILFGQPRRLPKFLGSPTARKCLLHQT